MINDIQLTLERYGISNFLFYKTINTNVNVADFQKLRQIYFPTILPIQILNKNEITYIRYDLTTENTLTKFLGESNTKKKLLRLLTEIRDTLKLLSKSNLDINNIVFDKEHIFIDEFTNRFQFIYIPIREIQESTITLNEFIKEIILNYKYEDDDYKFFVILFNKLVSDGVNSVEALDEIISCIDYKSSSIEEVTLDRNPNIDNSQDIGNDSNLAIVIDSTEEVQCKSVSRTNIYKNIDVKDKANSLNLRNINIIPTSDKSMPVVGEKVYGQLTTLLCDDNSDFETTALTHSEGINNKAYILISNKSKKVIIDKNNFKLGRDSSLVDCVILNKAIGRNHGEIIYKDGEYYFKDNNSTNGSYLNGYKIDARTEYKINHKDIIKLANEQIIFKLY